MASTDGKDAPAPSIWAKVAAAARPGGAVPQSCAVDASQVSASPEKNPRNNMETGGNARAADQRMPLPVQRQRSTIPIADVRPGHQPGPSSAEGAAPCVASVARGRRRGRCGFTQTPTGPDATAGSGSTWVYPSEQAPALLFQPAHIPSPACQPSPQLGAPPQMFFNAMKRKGWAPREEDMRAVVAIHNTVNERAWHEIQAWEALHCGECAAPKLLRFVGKPTEYSPKARLLNALGYKLPFDRHDWTVDRCGTHVRYVIDFYNAVPRDGVPIAMHLDVRPALDSPGALVDRIYMQMRWMGIVAGGAGGGVGDAREQQHQAPP